MLCAAHYLKGGDLGQLLYYLPFLIGWRIPEIRLPCYVNIARKEQGQAEGII